MRLLTVLLLFSLSGCIHRGPQPPKFGAPGNQILDATTVQILQEAEARQAKHQFVRGKLKGKARQQGRKRSFRQLFAAGFPGQIHLELESSLGQTVASLISDGQQLYYRERGESIPLVSGTDAYSVERTFGYRISLEQLVESLLGRTQMVELQEGQSISTLGDRLSIPDSRDSLALEYGFNPRTGRLETRLYKNETGEPRLLVEYLQWSEGSEGSYPEKLLFYDFESESQLEFETLRWAWNPRLPPSIFRLPLD